MFLKIQTGFCPRPLRLRELAAALDLFTWTHIFQTQLLDNQPFILNKVLCYSFYG